MRCLKMAKKKETNKKPIVETKQKLDNSIEIQVNKAPSKTLFGKISCKFFEIKTKIFGYICISFAPLDEISCIISQQVIHDCHFCF